MVYYIYSSELPDHHVKKDQVIKEIRRYLYEAIFPNEVSTQPLIDQYSNMRDNINIKVNNVSYRIEDVINYNWGRVHTGTVVFYII
jgi:cell fate (sporulation/competence/biofilm development) regulator YmcA (YheA/YmcA/DUF963 family)